MPVDLPKHARIVIIGGGIIGTSVAYHLTKLGCADVVLVEKNKLTSGSTWHAAGAVGQLRASANITRLLQHSPKLYAALEKETGQATGWVQNGSLRMACTPDRVAEYERLATTARSFGIDYEMVSPLEVKKMVPQFEVGDLICALYVPSDGLVNPTDVTMALAKGAKTGGAKLFENVEVIATPIRDGTVHEVVTSSGTIKCEAIVNCAGIWSREVGRLAGVNVPLQPAHHQYFITEKVDGLPKNIPTIRDADYATYFKEEVGGFVVGAYESNPIPYLDSPIPRSHEFRLMEPMTDHFEPWLHSAIKRAPILQSLGVKRWINGIESFTEDGMFIIGEAPEVRNYYVCAGFNAFGIASGGGAGRAMAEWVYSGEPTMDLWAADIRRFGPYHRSDRQVRLRSLEGQARHYAMGWPFLESEAGRPLRHSPIYDRLAGKRACFGAKFGWERPNWFAPADVAPRDEYSFGRQNWFQYSALEHKACRERVGVFDQSSFAKFRLTGPDAQDALQRLCAADVAKPVGSISYTQMLNRHGGIECDLTVSRLRDDAYFIVTGTGFATHDLVHIQRNMPDGTRAAITEVTSQFGCLSVMGPKSRDVLSSITETDLSNAGFPFGACREVFIAGAPVIALRVSFVGELGWELHIPMDYMAGVYESVMAAGKDFGIADCGYRAIDSLRLEKAYRIWAADIGPDFTPFEAGLGFCVALNKKADFIGKEALLRQKEGKLARRLAIFTIDDPDTILLGRETIYRDGVRVGWLSSGGFGHTVGKNIGLGYVRNEDGVTPEYLQTGKYELEARTKRVPAKIHLRPLYDPENVRLKS
jgi:sarcosine dehydrogenase